MRHFKAIGVAVGATVAFTAYASPANAAPLTPAALLTVSSVNCSSNPGAVHVNVPYVPYAYCYSGSGRKTISLTQVNSVESKNHTVTVLWKPPGGSWMQTGLIPNETLYIQGGQVDTIAM